MCLDKIFLLVFFQMVLLSQFTFGQKEVRDSMEQQFSIDNCVITFDLAKVDSTKVGYQYWFVDKNFLDGRTLKMSVVSSHQASHAPHTHRNDEFFFILEGTAEFHLNGKTTTGGPYTSFYCPVNSTHGIRNIGTTELKYLVIKKYGE